MVPFWRRRPRARVWPASRWWVHPVGWKPTAAAGQGAQRAGRAAGSTRWSAASGGRRTKRPASRTSTPAALCLRPPRPAPPSQRTRGEAAAVVLQQLGHVLLAHHPQRHCGSAARMGAALLMRLATARPGHCSGAARGTARGTAGALHARAPCLPAAPGTLELGLARRGGVGAHLRAGWCRRRRWSAGLGTQGGGPGSPGSAGPWGGGEIGRGGGC
jgi:hypothetical protein